MNQLGINSKESFGSIYPQCPKVRCYDLLKMFSFAGNLSSAVKITITHSVSYLSLAQLGPK
jgi:hypothetical protein